MIKECHMKEFVSKIKIMKSIHGFYMILLKFNFKRRELLNKGGQMKCAFNVAAFQLIGKKIQQYVNIDNRSFKNRIKSQTRNTKIAQAFNKTTSLKTANKAKT